MQFFFPVATELCELQYNWLREDDAQHNICYVLG